METADNGVHLLDYWAILVRRRWVVVLSISVFVLVALLGSFLVTPLYRASASVHVERLNPQIFEFRDPSSVDYSWAAYSDFYQTQYKILASDAVAVRAVQRLGLTSHPLFDGDPAAPGLFARLRSLLPSRRAKVQRDPLYRAAARIQGSLEITPLRNTQLIRVSWISPDPELAAQVANAVVDAYVQFNLESKFTTSDQATEFLVEQTGQLKREITAIERRLQEYGEAKGIVSIDESSNITLRALADVAQRRTEAQTRLAAAEATYDSIKESPPEALPAVLDSPLINRLQEDYASYEAEYSEKARLFKDGWPGMQTLRSKLDQAGERLQLETERVANQTLLAAEADYREAREAVANLDRLLAQQERAAQSLRRDAVEYANLKSEVEKKRETLNSLIARQNEMALSTRLQDLDVTSSNIRVVDRAQPPTAPFKPSTRLNLLVGLVLGVGIGVGLAFFLDYIDNTISSPAQLEGLTSLPLLAMIPRHGERASSLTRMRRRGAPQAVESLDHVASRQGRTRAAEAFRELRTALLLSSPGAPPRRTMVTSALPEEGKSATAINLAIVLAQLGRRVLLVDTDLRRPRLHKAFGVANGQGVSTVLTGLEEQAPSLVVPSGVESLDLLPSGPVPPNPSELLNSPVFERLVSRLVETGYDHVVFDSPPVLSVTDPTIIGGLMHAVLLVVRAEKTPRQSVRHAADRLRQAGIRPTGVVLNDVRPESTGYQNYYHYYGDGAGGEAAPAAAGKSRLGGGA